MVSLGPDTQSCNYSHMYSFVDLANSHEPQLCINKDSIYDFLHKNPHFSKFKQIVHRAKMEGQLNEIQANFTLFIPSDSSLQDIPQDFFDKMDDGLARQILKSSSLLRKIDKYLITSSPVAYYRTMDPTMRMYVTNISGRTQINNCVSVVKYDIVLNNGIIHLVDGLIVPSDDTFMN